MLLCSRCSADEAQDDAAEWQRGGGTADEETLESDNIRGPTWLHRDGRRATHDSRANGDFESTTSDDESMDVARRGPICSAAGRCSVFRSDRDEWGDSNSDSDQEAVDVVLPPLARVEEENDGQTNRRRKFWPFAQSKSKSVTFGEGEDDDENSGEDDEDDSSAEEDETRGAAMSRLRSSARQPGDPGLVRDVHLGQAAASDCINYVVQHKRVRAKGLKTQRLIVDAVMKNKLCTHLPEADVKQIADLMEFCTFNANEVVFKQGEPGCFFFIVQEGELEVIVSGESIDKLHAGSAFGSLSLLYNCPRSATIKCLTNVGLWACDGRTFRQLVQSNLKRDFQQHRTFVNSIKLLDGLTAKQKDRLGAAFLPESYAAGVDVVTEGRQAQSLYLIRKGELRVVIGGQPLQALGPGDVFGERAFLFNEPRSATVITISPCELLRLGYDQLQAALGGKLSPQLLRRNFLLTSLRCSPVFAMFSPTQLLALVEQMDIVAYDAGCSIDHCEFGLVIDGEARTQGFMGMGSGFGAKVLTRGHWFGSGPVVDGAKPDGHDDRGALVGYFVARSSAERSNKSVQGHKLDDLGGLQAGRKGCSLAVLTSDNLTDALQNLGMPGVGSAEGALDVVRRVTALGQIYVFNNLPQKQMDKLVGALVLQEFHMNATVIQQGEHGTMFHIVASGQLGVFVDGRKVRTLGPNGYFGERALFLEEPRSATVKVLSNDAEIWSIDKDTFMQIFTGKLMEHLMNRVSLHDSNITLKDLTSVRVIGKGSFGVVRLVTHVKTGMRYALKRVKKAGGILPPELVYECEMMAELDHPFMVYLVRTMETPRHVYLLTELITGGDLFSAVKQITRAGLKPREARFYVGSMAIALEVLHSKGIVYRDLKPQNIMLDHQGYCKIIDFGTAKQLNGGQTYTAIGTPFYIAPELLQGHGYGTEPDLWSMGVVLYELMCDQYPFGDGLNDVTKIYIEVINANVKFPTRLKDSAARLLIKGLLHRDASERLGSGIGGWNSIKDSKFFVAGAQNGQSFFDRLQSRVLEAPVVPEGGEDGELGEVFELPGTSLVFLNDNLSDADELAQ